MFEFDPNMTVREYLDLTRYQRMEAVNLRPTIEVWPDPWVDWVEGHRRAKGGGPEYIPCDVVENKATPTCMQGIH